MHGDVKPGNILVDPANPCRVVLIDYGVSRAIRPQVQSPVVNPEQFFSIPGTLHFASLHLHRGSCMSPHDRACIVSQ